MTHFGYCQLLVFYDHHLHLARLTMTSKFKRRAGKEVEEEADPESNAPAIPTLSLMSNSDQTIDTVAIRAAGNNYLDRSITIIYNDPSPVSGRAIGGEVPATRAGQSWDANCRDTTSPKQQTLSIRQILRAYFADIFTNRPAGRRRQLPVASTGEDTAGVRDDAAPSVTAVRVNPIDGTVQLKDWCFAPSDHRRRHTYIPTSNGRNVDAGGNICSKSSCVWSGATMLESSSS